MGWYGGGYSGLGEIKAFASAFGEGSSPMLNVQLELGGVKMRTGNFWRKASAMLMALSIGGLLLSACAPAVQPTPAFTLTISRAPASPTPFPSATFSPVPPTATPTPIPPTATPTATPTPKPLEITCLSGPVSNYVNHDVIFEVTSEGQPVEGATVHFAGYEKLTGEDGRVVFNIDMAGPFKARVEKPGYEDASTLLWVFPEGNEKIPIRAIRTLSGGQAGTTIIDYRMAGANCASIKVYYLYDEDGNIYPADPFPVGWRELPREVHKKYQEWMISTVRDWGFEKVYLILESLPAALFEKGLESKASLPPISGEVERNYLEQMQKEALLLAGLAEQQNVNILDYVVLETPSELLVYKELLPEIRKRFSGELAVQPPDGVRYFVNGTNPPERDYSGFDYITPVFSCRQANLNTDSPSEWENAMQKYLEHAKQIGEKYGAKVMPVWLAGLEVHDEQLLNQFLINGKFEDYEDVKVWLLNSILEESSKRNVDGVEAYTLWYHSRRADPHGPCGYKFPIWQSKRPLDTVAKYFSNPWNEGGRETLRVLQHAALLTNSIASHNQEFAELVGDWIAEALRAYRSGDYYSASLISNKIFEKMSRVENPFGIKLDGDGSEWRSLDPVYFNPSTKLPWSNIPWFVEMKKELKNIRNLKAVYAVNDSENLYLMLEFYDQVPEWIPYIDIDTSGEWTHQNGKEFHIILDPRGGTLWTSEYKGSEWSCRDPQTPTSQKLGDLKLGYGKVVEVEIPLELIGNPEEVNLIVYYPWMAPWGGMEANIVKWYENTR